MHLLTQMNAQAMIEKGGARRSTFWGSPHDKAAVPSITRSKGLTVKSRNRLNVLFRYKLVTTGKGAKRGCSSLSSLDLLDGTVRPSPETGIVRAQNPRSARSTPPVDIMRAIVHKYQLFIHRCLDLLTCKHPDNVVFTSQAQVRRGYQQHEGVCCSALIENQKPAKDTAHAESPDELQDTELRVKHPLSSSEVREFALP